MHNNSRSYAHLTAFSSYGRSLISTLVTRTPSIMANDQGWPIGGWPLDSISIYVCWRHILFCSSWPRDPVRKWVDSYTSSFCFRAPSRPHSHTAIQSRASSAGFDPLSLPWHHLLIDSTSSYKFGSERTIRAQRGLHERQSLKESRLITNL